MDQKHLLTLYDEDQRRNVHYPDGRREVTASVIRHIATSADGEGTIVYSDLTAANADSVIQEQIAFFEALGQDFEWKLYSHDQPSDLQARLAAAGFVIEEAEAIMVLALDEAPPVLWQPVQHTVQRIVDPAHLTAVQQVQAAVWGEGNRAVIDFLAESLREHPDLMSIYVAYIDQQPACAAWIYFPPQSQFASLWGGSTVSAYRNRGLYSALLAVRAQEARARRVHYLTVDASPMSRPILEKLGFEFITYSYPCKWTCSPQN